MSTVPKSQRKESLNNYLSLMTEVRIKAFRITKRFPKSYELNLKKEILDLTSKAYFCMSYAHDITLHPNMSMDDFNEKQRNFIKAKRYLGVLLKEIKFCRILLSEGNNFFKSNTEMHKKLDEWSASIIQTQSSLTRIIKLNNSYKNKRLLNEEKDMVE